MNGTPHWTQTTAALLAWTTVLICVLAAPANAFFSFNDPNYPPVPTASPWTPVWVIGAVYVLLGVFLTLFASR